MTGDFLIKVDPYLWNRLKNEEDEDEEEEERSNKYITPCKMLHSAIKTLIKHHLRILRDTVSHY